MIVGRYFLKNCRGWYNSDDGIACCAKVISKLTVAGYGIMDIWMVVGLDIN